MENGQKSAAIVQNRGKQPMTLKQYFEKHAHAALSAVAPKHMTAERLVKIALLAASRSPELAKCAPESILRAVMQGAEIGLEAGGLLGEAYIVPFFNKKTGKMEAQMIPGYRGLIKLARNSGQITSIEAHVVRERDQFTLIYGLDAKLEHVPCLKGDPGPVVAAYAIARFKDGGYQVEVMTRAELDAVKARSKSPSSGPWVTDEAEMQKKTVVRRLCKYLPLSPELALARAIEADEAANGDAPQTIDVELIGDTPVEDAEPQTRTDVTRAKLAAMVPTDTPSQPYADGHMREPGEEG